MKKHLALGLCLLAQTLWAFPEMIRHGYANCTTCHYSPNGGGILNEYGRTLSKELLSTWGIEGEERALSGLVSFPDWLSLGGDFRLLQTYQNTERFERADFLFMQADVEAAVTLDKFRAVAAVGRQSPESMGYTGAALYSRKHYLQFDSDSGVSVRAGKFQSAIGINTAEHMISTKRGLGWDEGSETYNVEAAYLGESFDVFVTGILGRPDAPDLGREKGFALRSSYFLNSRYKLGATLYWGKKEEQSRYHVGPYFILGFTPRLFLLEELAYENHGAGCLFNYSRLDYEITQGLHIYLTLEYGKKNLDIGKTASDSYGLGLQFFPRPHLELNSMLLKMRVRAMSENFSDFFWLLLHYYL